MTTAIRTREPVAAAPELTPALVLLAMLWRSRDAGVVHHRATDLTRFINTGCLGRYDVSHTVEAYPYYAAQVRYRFAPLLRENLIVRTAHGRYRLTVHGHDAASMVEDAIEGDTF